MNRKRKFATVGRRNAQASKGRQGVAQARAAKPLLLVSLFAAFLVFGLAYTFSGGSYPYYSLAAVLVAGLGSYEVARLQHQDKIH